MTVHRPSDNPITQGYTTAHRGYDLAGLNRPDEVRAGKDGAIIERVDAYTSNWRTIGRLTTRDYGNYIKVKHTDGSFSLYCHLRKGSSYIVGTQVKAGQVIARIGNTGNSTGPHLHVEYRTSANVNTPVTFANPAQASGETIPVNKATFEKLVSNSSKYDAFVAAGFPDPQAVKKQIEDLKKQPAPSDKTKELEKKLAELSAERDRLVQLRDGIEELVQLFTR